MTAAKRFRLLFKVVPVVILLVGAKVLLRRMGWEIITLDILMPSAVAGSIFIVGFLLSHLLADYKEAERMPGEMRVALESIHEEAANFARKTGAVDMAALRQSLRAIVSGLDAGLTTRGAARDLDPVVAEVDALSEVFGYMESQGMSERYIVRMRLAQDTIRRWLYRIAYVQTMRSIPSASVMAQSLVLFCLAILMFLKAPGTYESALILGFIGFLFTFALLLIHTLERPFRKGEHSLDDVSLFLLRDFAVRIGDVPPPPEPGVQHLRRAGG
jgi:hypothetical protein